MDLSNLKEIKIDELPEPKPRPINRRDSVIIEFGEFKGLDEIHAVDIRLWDSIPPEIGEHDGHEVAMDDTHGWFFSYGRNAEELFKVMKPILMDFEFLSKAIVHLKFYVDENTSRELDFSMKTLNNL